MRCFRLWGPSLLTLSFVAVTAGSPSLRGESGQDEKPAEAPLLEKNAARDPNAASSMTTVLASVVSPSDQPKSSITEYNENFDLLSDVDETIYSSLDTFVVPEYSENDLDETNEQRDRMLVRGYSMRELQNAAMIQGARVKRNLQKIAISSDTQREARRWAVHMARTRTVSSRNPVSQNITGGWSKLAELDGSGDSVAIDGVFAQFMSANRSRAIILDPVYNRVGVGIAKNRTKFFVCYIFKAISV